MLRKVRVRMPQAQSGLEVKMKAGLGFNANQLSWPVMAGEFSQPNVEVRHTLEEVDIEHANLEAEVGETAVTNLNADGIPEHYKIGGKRHYDGGTPLNLPDNSYIFSRDNSMKIKDADVLSQFGITKFPRSGITPADIAKKYDINKYKKILLDKDSDDMARSTAEMMISNYMLKLGKLALIQESMKAFPEGIPLIAMPYLESIGMDPKQVLPSQEDTYGIVQAEQEQPDADVEARYGKELRTFQIPPSETGTNGWTVIPAPNKYGNKPVWFDTQNNKIYANSDYKPSGIGKTAMQQLAGNNQGSSSARAAAPAQGASRGASSSAKRGNMQSVDLVVPPLTYNTGANKPDYDVRLSEKSNKKYNALVTALQNTDVKDKLINQYKIILARKDKTNKLSDSEIRKLEAMSPDEILNDFLQYQKQNWAIADADERNVAAGRKSFLEKPQNGGVGLDTYGNTGNTIHKQLLKNMGFETEGIQEELDVAGVQATSQAILEVMNMPEYKEAFKGFQIRRKGTHTDPGNYIDPKTGQVGHTSAIDRRAGDDTDAFLVDWMGEEQAKQCPPCPDGTIPKMDENGKCPCDGEKVTQCPPCPDGTVPVRDASGKCPCSDIILPPKDTPWWIQDVIKTSGAFGDMGRVKKYLPWQATPSVDYMEPTFYSPERELAANAEQLSIGAQGIAQFTGPQAYNARFSQMSGKAAANAADILGRYNQLNVGVANEAEKFNVDVFNKYAEARADDATKLFDKVTIANQEFDNSKNKARQELRQSYIDAITNRAQAYNYNQLYPDWKIDPMSGGRIERGPYRDIDPSEYKPQDEIANINQWMNSKPADVTSDTWLDQYNAIQGYSRKNSSGSSKASDEYYIDMDGKKKRKPSTSSIPGYPAQSPTATPPWYNPYQ